MDSVESEGMLAGVFEDIFARILKKREEKRYYTFLPTTAFVFEKVLEYRNLRMPISLSM